MTVRLPPPPLANGEGKPPAWLKLRSPLSYSFRNIKPWRDYIAYVDLAARNGDLAMARYRDTFSSLTADSQRKVLPEQICELAGVSPGELYGAVSRAMWETQGATSSMIGSIEHPKVLQKTARLAMKADHFKDREMFFAITGSLPHKKGASITIFNNPSASSHEVKLDMQIRPKLKSFDEAVIDMSRELEPAGPPFLVDEEKSDEQGLD